MSLFWRLLRPATLVALFALLTIAAQDARSYYPSLAPSPHNACVDTFVRALRSLKASGIWECITPHGQSVYFVNNGWKGDADFQAWLDGIAKGGVGFDVIYYPDNPVQVCNPGAACVPTYFLYISPIYPDGTKGNGSGVAITLGADGRIDLIS